MPISIFLIFLALISGGVAAQQDDEAVLRSSSPSGMRIQNDAATQTKEASSNYLALPGGTPKTGKAATSAKENTHIRGSTRIDAQGSNVNATSAGKNNRAINSIGNIGGQ